VIRAALGLARRGVPVFPVWGSVDGVCQCGKDCGRNAGKHPIPAKGFLEASTHPATVLAWWQRHPEANVGVRTGMPFRGGRLLVVDIDRAKEGEVGGEDALQQLPLPETLRVRTGSGGMHLWYWAPEDACPTIGSRIEAGGVRWAVDWRGRGGYVLAPPSRHVAGRYAWEGGEIAEAGPELLGLLRKEPPKMAVQPVVLLPLGEGRAARYLEGALKGEVDRLLTCPEGGRHRQMLRSAYKLGGYYRPGVDVAAIEAAMVAAWSQVVGAREREARKAFCDGWNAGVERPRLLPGERVI